jgi:6-phosphogluconate dehydrogenase
VAGLDLDEEKFFTHTRSESTTPIKATIDVKEFVGLIKQPRAIMLLVPAGNVDTAIDLLPYLDKGDILIDGGNTYFTDTDRRFTALSAKGFTFLEWVSQEEKRARFGPSLMPGGNKEAYERLRPIFESIAAN